jgi:6-phosphogluconolactonase
VPPDHPDSNYRMALETLLSKVPVAPQRIHRMPAELPDADEAARRYEATLRAELGPALRFDFVFLGLGPDGHTASLFPGTPVVQEKEKLVASVWVEAKKSRRLTLTFPVLNAAARAAFVVSGAEKADMVRRAIEEPASDMVPAGKVVPTKGELLWLLDRDAASRLTPDLKS